MVLLANRRAEEAELGWFANYQAKLSIGDLRLGAFFHAERHNAKRLQRGFHARHSRHSAFDPDVIRARGATSDSDSLSTPGPAIVSRSSRYCVIEIGRIQDVRPAKRLEPFPGQPEIQYFHQPASQRRCFHDTAVRSEERRVGKEGRSWW